MSPAQRLLIIAGLWELAMAWASSFVGAWFWHIRTAVSTIIFYYLLWFLVMGLVYGWAAMTPHSLRYQWLRGTGIAVAITYLGLLTVLGPASGHLVWVIAALTGFSSGFYWLSLYVGGAATVPPQKADWYNAWIGIVENVFAIVGPPVAAGIIAAFSSGVGYRVVFGLAMAILAGALVFGLEPFSPSTASASRSRTTPPKGAWHDVRWSMAALGLRDGILFFVPGLYLFIMTKSPLWLGWYLAIQAGVQTLAFWVLAHRSQKGSTKTRRRTALLMSVVSGGIFILLPTIPGVLILGVLTSVAYPIYKVQIEGHALAVIQETSQHSADQVGLTSMKELWLNSGRMMSFLIFLGFLTIGPSALAVMRIILALWPLTTLLIHIASRTSAKKNNASSA